MMEEKLIIGGEVISRASKQEGLLRKAEQELRERQQQETRLARELAEKEEANLQLEGTVVYLLLTTSVLYNLTYVFLLNLLIRCKEKFHSFTAYFVAFFHDELFFLT